MKLIGESQPAVLYSVVSLHLLQFSLLYNSTILMHIYCREIEMNGFIIVGYFCLFYFFVILRECFPDGTFGNVVELGNESESGTFNLHGKAQTCSIMCIVVGQRLFIKIYSFKLYLCI